MVVVPATTIKIEKPTMEGLSLTHKTELQASELIFCIQETKLERNRKARNEMGLGADASNKREGE